MKAIELFTASLNLIGIYSDGEKLPADTEDLKYRAVALINILLAENALLDSGLRKSDLKIMQITNLDEDLICSDVMANSVLPYGLARLLVLGEDDSLSNELYRLYVESRENARRFIKANIHPIEEVY